MRCGPRRARTVLLDLDGTLLDPKEGITRSIQYALRRLGRPVPAADRLLWCIGPPLLESLERLLDGSPALAAEALHLYRERFGAVGMYEGRVYDGIPEALETLRGSGARLFVATAKPTAFAVEIASHFGLSPFFGEIYGSELDGRRTDKAELIAHVVASEGLDRSDTVMVGDRRHDVRGARRNGIAALGVSYGYGSREELIAAGAGDVVDRPAGLPGALLGDRPAVPGAGTRGAGVPGSISGSVAGP